MQEISLGVRTLVEFTLHGEDIVQAYSLRAMQDGSLGHRARQKALKALGEGWESEVPLSEPLPYPAYDVSLTLSGRMDGFLDGSIPEVEEMKLWQGEVPPSQPAPEHRAQAVCYARLLFFSREELTHVVIRIAYVTRDGEVRALFPETLDRDSCFAAFDALALPYLAHVQEEAAHRQRLAQEIRSLDFPFPAWRPGQREYAAQVYTAIRLHRRLFASMPTGTGKSAATLFPALKALGEGRTERIFYLTARTTQRQGPLDAASRMRLPSLRVLVLEAKDRVCPEGHICHPDFCPRAKGHFLRDSEGIREMLGTGDWSGEHLRAVADRHMLCPFEFSLSLCEIADLVICDYNYALDPAIRLQRIFLSEAPLTLLIDEAHHLLPRIRDMLSGEADAKGIRSMRAALSSQVRRNHPLYAALTRLLKLLKEVDRANGGDGKQVLEMTLSDVPEGLEEAAREVTDAYFASAHERISYGERAESVRETISQLLHLQRALHENREKYACLLRTGSTRIKAFRLDAADHFASATQGMAGVVCFSATLDPLPEMKRLLGGEAEDACFSVPSPFPRENLLVVHSAINMRYSGREQSVPELCGMIRTLFSAKQGKYIVFFPSFAFLRMAQETLSEWTEENRDTMLFQAQTAGMGLEARDAFLAPYLSGDMPVLSFCVLGGVFAEGIDLPGDCLDGVLIAGVGLPMVCQEQNALSDWYEKQYGDGFLYAYILPGLQKVAQAAGRVIRSETDRGVVWLADDRFLNVPYVHLLPRHWEIRRGVPGQRLERFYARENPAIDAGSQS